MSAHILLNLLNVLEEKIRCETLPSILSISSNEFNKFNNTGGRTQDSIYHMTLKSHFIRDFRIKTSRFRHKKTRRFLWTSVHNVICIYNPRVDYRFQCMVLHSQTQRHMKNKNNDLSKNQLKMNIIWH